MNADTARKLEGLSEPLRSIVRSVLERTGEQTWIKSGRRTLQEQIDLRRAHCGTSWWAIWVKPAGDCNPPTAVPGRSRHETGNAVDLGGNVELAADLARGLLDRPVRGENWHFEVTDATQAAFLAGGGRVPGIDLPDVDLPSLPSLPGSGAVGDALGEAVEPFVDGLKRITLVGILLAGGAALVVMGGIRGAGKER